MKFLLQTMDMNNEQGIDNKVFMSAFSGVVLLIATVAMAVLTYGNAMGEQLPAVTLLAIVGITAVSLLYKAVKKDKRSLAYGH